MSLGNCVSVLSRNLNGMKFFRATWARKENVKTSQTLKDYDGKASRFRSEISADKKSRKKVLEVS